MKTKQEIEAYCENQDKKSLDLKRRQMENRLQAIRDFMFENVEGDEYNHCAMMVADLHKSVHAYVNEFSARQFRTWQIEYERDNPK